MKQQKYLGFSEQEIFKNEEDKNRILSMKEVEKETEIAKRVEELKHEKERKILFQQKNNETQNKKVNYNDDYSDGEELGEIKQQKKKSKRKKSNESNGEASILSDDDEDDKQNKKETMTTTLEDMKKIVLARNFFEKYYLYPNFDEKIVGSFIRMNLANTGDREQPGYTGYQIDKIEKIIISDKPYDFSGNKCTKYIKLKNFGSNVNFLIISNSAIIEEELNKLKQDNMIPTKEDIDKIEQNIQSIKNYELKPEELQNILTQKKKDRIRFCDSTLNVTEELDRATEQYRALKEEYEELKEELEKEERENYLKQMKELNDDIKQLEKMKEERDKKAKLFLDNDIVAKINEDIKEKRRMDEKMSLLAKKRKNALNSKTQKIFKRVDCHPTNLFDSGKINTEGLDLLKKETSDFIENKEKKKEENNFSYGKKIRQFKEFISSKKELIDEMMEFENKKKKEIEENNKLGNEMEIKEKEEEKKDRNNINNIDISLFFKLASINYDAYNKMIKDENKKNTKEPTVKIIEFNDYLNENIKE